MKCVLFEKKIRSLIYYFFLVYLRPIKFLIKLEQKDWAS